MKDFLSLKKCYRWALSLVFTTDGNTVNKKINIDFRPAKYLPILNSVDAILWGHLFT